MKPVDTSIQIDVFHQWLGITDIAANILYIFYFREQNLYGFILILEVTRQ